jgi:hypothetical protein
VDTDHSSWLILLHCSDPEAEKKFLSTFVLSRVPYVDKLTTEYLREKISAYDIDLEYLFPVNQTFCFGEELYPTEEPVPTTPKPVQDDDENDLNADENGDMYFEEDVMSNDSNNADENQQANEENEPDENTIQGISSQSEQ